MMMYRIFPAIGIARIGGNHDFFLGPEIPGQGPIELDGSPARRFKNSDGTLIRKQGARFRVFQSADDGATWAPLAPGATVEWSVTLHNKKASIIRELEPPTKPERPRIDPALVSMHIQAPTAKVSGVNAAGAPMTGTFTTKDAGGAPYNATVKLGSLRTDGAGNLIVLGGDGISDAPPGTPIGTGNGTSYFKSPNWYDDVADGPVSAVVNPGPGEAPVTADGGAWVIVAPPDYAPAIGGVVTLYDVILQVGVDHFGISVPAIPSFDREIMPMIRRVRRHRWVNDAAIWSNPALDAADSDLRSKDVAMKALKIKVCQRIRESEEQLEGHTDPDGPPFLLRQHQQDTLDAWLAGTFDDAPSSFGSEPTPANLTRAALEGAVGQGFCPGIEAGILVLDQSIYRKPFDFRIDHAGVEPGDMTALMAQPWQADFLKCNTEWWPSQRPDVAPQSGDFTDNEEWSRGIGSSHRKLAKEFQRLGFVVQTGPESFIEAERDKTF
ncbi:hypothetical protein B5P46_25180 [Rhizobium leguminosarum]|uniref:Uncharacterized protein n=1 Tax=Rhizobium leguminosarum TaxID=384 RepID=A0A4Q1TM57_RHILE|nr:LodA/GoxA family CTQ-dependent oxidase [Rhizobium leguminosarum]RXT19604.1 hypothetical protein B5P46_25180 [Rhizobium leguminosarum]